MKKVIQKYADGYSAREIAEQEELGLAKVYYILKKNNIPRRTPSQTNAIRFEKSTPSFNVPTSLDLHGERLKNLALGLYWGEGSKTSNVVDIANSDPMVLKIFLLYLLDYLKVDKSRLRVGLYCFDDQSMSDLVQFWSTHLDIPKKQFIKPYVRVEGSKRTRKMPYGVAHLRYSDKRLLKYLLEEISRSKNLLVGGAGFEPAKA